MEHFLAFFVVILAIIVVFTMLNEKFFHLANEIILLLFSLIAGVVLLIWTHSPWGASSEAVMDTISAFRIDKLLLDGILCFMLFTGASELKLPHLVHNFKPILLLALLTTVIASVIYGFLFWLVGLMLGLDLDFTLCILLGSIVSPTDPIAATSILSKMGLTKNVTAVMEGESLFNDGTGVALFIFVKNLIQDTKSSNFFAVMSKELFGAILLGLLISFVCSLLIKMTTDPIKHIIISMFAVSLCYVLCEMCGFSGVIASVICGIFFSTMMDRYKAMNEDLDPDDYYKDFWSIIDKILNYILYVLIGISFVYITRIKYFVLIAFAAIIFNLVARYLGVLLSTGICRQCPDDYKIQPFTILMTWSGLKGGLCLALAMSASNFLSPDHYNFILYVTFVTIIFTTVAQGLTVGKIFELVNKTLDEAPIQQQS